MSPNKTGIPFYYSIDIVQMRYHLIWIHLTIDFWLEIKGKSEMLNKKQEMIFNGINDMETMFIIDMWLLSIKLYVLILWFG